MDLGIKTDNMGRFRRRPFPGFPLQDNRPSRADKNKKSGQTLDRHVGCLSLFSSTCRPSPLQGSGDANWKNEAPPVPDRQSVPPADQGGRLRPEPASHGRFSGGTKAREIARFRIGSEHGVASAGPREAAWGRPEAVEWRSLKPSKLQS